MSGANTIAWRPPPAMDGLVLVNFELHEEIGEECDATQSASLMLYAGVPTAELQSMLAAVFGITQASSIAGQPRAHPTRLGRPLTG